MKKLNISLDKINPILGYPYLYDNSEDPIRKMIEERFGKILKVFIMNDGSYLTLCEKNMEDQNERLEKR